MEGEILDGEFKSEMTRLIATVIEKIDGLAKDAEINGLKVDGLASDVRTNSFKLDKVESRLQNVEENLGRVDGNVSTLNTRVERLEVGVKEMTVEVRQLKAQFGDALKLSFRNEDRIEVLETRVDGLDARIH